MSEQRRQEEPSRTEPATRKKERFEDTRVRWTLYFPWDLRRAVEEEKIRTGRSHAHIIEEALRQYFERKG